MQLEDFEKYLNQNFLTWIFNSNQIPFGINDSQLLNLKNKYLLDIYCKWILSNRKAKYFWFENNVLMYSSGFDKAAGKGSIGLRNEILQYYRSLIIDEILK